MRESSEADDTAGLVETVERYASVESPSGDAAALTGFADILDADARAAGFHTARQPHASGDDLVWTLPARDVTGPPLVLLTHYDTVWPRGTLATMSVHRDGDRLCGPGVFDTKAGIAVILHAARVLADMPHAEVRVLVTADEEVGSPASTPLIQRETAGAFAVLGFEPPHPDGALKTARRGSTRARITVTGVESHAGLDPAAGVNAIDELLDQLTVVRERLGRMPVLANTGVIAGGTRTNVVAGTAHADLGLRFVDTATEDETLRMLRGLTPLRRRAVLETELLSHRPTWPARQPGTTRLAAACARIAETAGVALAGRPADGAGDTNTAGAAGIPTVDGLAPWGGGAHARGEWVSMAGIAQRARLVPALLAGLRPGDIDSCTTER